MGRWYMGQELVGHKWGRLRVAIVSFATPDEREAAEEIAKARGWKAKMAYSNRTKVWKDHRIDTYWKSQV